MLNTDQINRLGRWTAAAIIGAVLAAGVGHIVTHQLARWDREQDKQLPPAPQAPLVRPGETAFPYRHTASQEERFHRATFELVPEPQDEHRNLIGGSDSPGVVIFARTDYDSKTKTYSKEVTDIKAIPGEHGLVIVRILDRRQTGKWLYGRLTLYYGELTAPKKLEFEPAYVQVRKD